MLESVVAVNDNLITGQTIDEADANYRKVAMQCELQEQQGAV